MSLLDHFHPPLELQRSWTSFHARWASALSDWLNDGLLPPDYFAEPEARVGGPVEIDVATWEKPVETTSRAGNGAALAVTSQAWAPPAASLVMPAVFPGHHGVKVYRSEGGPTLVGAIELISPANKDRPEVRRAFAVKAADYLYQGVGLVIVDIVTSRASNLHDEIIRVMEREDTYLFRPPSLLYTVSYRPLRQAEVEQVEMWLTPLSLGKPLTTVPLWLGARLCLPVDLQTTYTEVCRRLRIPSES
jgi:hypothetical protein